VWLIARILFDDESADIAAVRCPKDGHSIRRPDGIGVLSRLDMLLDGSHRYCLLLRIPLAAGSPRA